MVKKILALAMCMTMVFSALPATALQAADNGGETVVREEAVVTAATEEDLGENVAREAKAKASYTNTYGISPDAMNDGQFATEVPETSWNSWGAGADKYPVEVSLNWENEYELTGMRVMWWADNAQITSDANVTFPKSCYVEYLDGDGAWQRISDVGVAYDASSNNGINGNNKLWNTVKFPETITTKGLRMYIERSGSGSNGVGISEWEAFGTKVPDAIGVGENIALNALATAGHSSTNEASKVNDGKLAEGADTSWNTWNSDEAYPATIDLNWDKLQEVDSMQVMWWADGVEVKFPKSCTVSYLDEKTEKWVDVTDMVNESKENVSGVGVKYTDTNGGINENNRYWNGVAFKKTFRTKRLRLSVDRVEAGSTGIGIGEWEVFGKEVGVTIGEGQNIAPIAKPDAAHQNTPVTNVNNGKLATGASSSWNTWGNPGRYPT